MHPDTIVVLNAAEYAVLLRCEETEGRLDESQLLGQGAEADVLIEHGLLKWVGHYALLTTRGTLFLANRRVAGELFWAPLMAEGAEHPLPPE